MACLIGHHAETKPLAILSITGIPTYRHAYFNSSVLLTPEPITEEEVDPYIGAPVSVGRNASRAAFYPESLLPSGDKRPDWVLPAGKPKGWQGDGRGILYDYFLYTNMFLPLVSDVDPGFAWAKEESGKEKLDAWPMTIIIQGDEDAAVSPDVSISVAKLLDSKALLLIAKGEEHLFENASFLEDVSPGMDVVREAVQALYITVERGLKPTDH
jgi:hypothetical protein